VIGLEAGSAETGRRVRFLTWNLAMFERAVGAPADWDQFRTEAAVRETILDLAPDLVLFQELPGVVPYVETHDMVRANPRSHSGNIATLVTRTVMEQQPTSLVVTRTALLTTFPNFDLTVANVHLSPGRGAATERLHQLRVVADASPTDNLVIIGDTNTRQAEVNAIVELGLCDHTPPSATWDSRRNRFRSGGASFVAYFTRVFSRGAVTVDNQRVLDDRPLEVDGRRFFLSDHFALAGTIEVGDKR
jgi:endonuclease/exonuclease/phosphatase family metal-dependent hydrolase